MIIGQNIFSGERPRLAEHLIRDYEAQAAKNCNLNRGDLRPFRAPSKIKNLDDGVLKTLYNWKRDGADDWIASTNILNFARSPVADEAHSRVYFTGMNEPRVLTSSIMSYPFNFNTDYYKLGVPAPVDAPTLGGSYTTGSGYRAYIYTYVVKLGDDYVEEGVNSDIASISDYGSGNVEISGFSEPPSNRSIGAIRIYRISSSSAGVAEFLYTGEFDTDDVSDWDTYTFTDNVAESGLGEVYSCATYSPPPQSLKGIIALKNGSLAGFTGKTVYLSEPYLPHAWPYTYPIDANIVGLGVIGTTLVVMTDEHTYLIEGQSDLASTRRLEGRYPCTSIRGIISGVFGVAYPSDEGIAIATLDNVTILSYEYFTREQYSRTYSPGTIRAAFYNNKYFAFHDGGSILIDVIDKTMSGISDPETASALHYSLVDNELYYIGPGDDDHDNGLYKFQGNKDNTYLQYIYKSKNYKFANPTNFVACKITISPDDKDNEDNITANATQVTAGLDGGLVDGFVVNEDEAVVNYDGLKKVYEATFKFYGDDALLHTETVTGDVIFTLPADVLYNRCYYEITGDLRIIEIKIAHSMEELMQ